MLQLIKTINLLFFIAFFVCIGVPASAQQSTSRPDSTASPINIQKKILKNFPDQPFVKIDSTRYTSFLPDAPELMTENYDTLLTDFHQHDPIRLQFGLGNLGNAGSAYRNLVFDIRSQMGFDVGMHQYDMYKVNTRQLRFYNTVQPISAVKGMLGSTKSDGSINGMLARKFAGNITVSFEAHRLNQTGQYYFQRVRNTAVVGGISFISENKKYNSF